MDIEQKKTKTCLLEAPNSLFIIHDKEGMTRNERPERGSLEKEGEKEREQEEKRE